MQNYTYSNQLYHHGILGMKWGVRRFQNKDGSLTKAGKDRATKNTSNADNSSPRKSIGSKFKNALVKTGKGIERLVDTHQNMVVEDQMTGRQRRAYDRMPKQQQQQYWVDRVAYGQTKANEFLEFYGNNGYKEYDTAKTMVRTSDVLVDAIKKKL